MRAGDVVWNPLTGEKAMIVESAAECGGTRIVADVAVEAGGFVPGGEHVHDGPPAALLGRALEPLRTARRDGPCAAHLRDPRADPCRGSRG